MEEFTKEEKKVLKELKREMEVSFEKTLINFNSRLMDLEHATPSNNRVELGLLNLSSSKESIDDLILKIIPFLKNLQESKISYKDITLKNKNKKIDLEPDEEGGPSYFG